MRVGPQYQAVVPDFDPGKFVGFWLVASNNEQRCYLRLLTVVVVAVTCEGLIHTLSDTKTDCPSYPPPPSDPCPPTSDLLEVAQAAQLRDNLGMLVWLPSDALNQIQCKSSRRRCR